ncbi:MAG TPA: enoyl-CoA hydratase/isomerase family protein [Gemmatimonadota bacterium]|nr:enoyl-CoA hydratase/isomerase family protein [Gemmatimonadota bacterium]
MTRPVRFEVGDDGVGLVTLARPEKRNALDPATIEGLSAALAVAEADPRVRVVLLAAEGKDFCAGADLAHIEATVDDPRDALVEDARRMAAIFLRMRRLPKPIVAAVHGSALAGGAGLATACDLVLASEDARFGYPEIHIGFVPAMVMTMLVRIVGQKQAFELATRGEPIGAERARDLGLVNCVYSRHTFPEDSRSYAAELATRSPTALALTKELFYELDDLSFADGLERGAEVNADARTTDDCRAGLRAILARRRGEVPAAE